MTAANHKKVPLSVVAWLANLVFVAIPVMACLLTLWFIVNPPKSAWAALFESHKVILVGAVTMSGVTLIEGFLLAVKLGTRNNRDSILFFLVGALVLVSAMMLAVIFYLVALVNEANHAALFVAAHDHTAPPITSDFIVQLVTGAALLVISIVIALRFKYIDSAMSEAEAAIPAPAPQGAPS